MKAKKQISIILCIFYLFGFVMLYSGCASSNDKQNSPTVNPTPSSVPSVESSSSPASSSNGETGDSSTINGSTGGKIQSSVYEPVKFEAKVKPYKVKGDLSNIVNLQQFGGFTQQQKEMLAKNGFMVAPSDEEQLFYIYEKNQYLKLPSFVTSDSVLQVYHVFFDYSLRTLESQKLFGILEQLTSDMLDKSVYFYGNIKNKAVKAEALRNVAFFAAAQLTLGKKLPADLPPDAQKLAEEEYSLISSAAGFDESPIFGFKLDYSQYKPRGHYTRSEEFEKFFRAMMWYGQAPFALYTKKDGEIVPDYKNAARSILITYSLYTNYKDMQDAALWDKIYEPTSFYVGSADDLTVLDLKPLILKAYGSEMDLDSILDENRMGEFFKEADKLPSPRIQAKWTTVDTPVEKQFRFMGQRYIPDSEIMQKLVDPDTRQFPSGLDVMGVLGSDRAYGLLDDRYKVPEQCPWYNASFNLLKDTFSGISENKWQSNMYYGWLWTLKSLIVPSKPGPVLFGQGYPSFMTNTAWTDKSLSTALGSWAELRHDTILYGKQSGAECGGDMAPPVIKGYVEPNVELYNKLLQLTRISREGLLKRDILTEDMQNRLQYFENLLDFLITCAVKELRNEELSKEEYDSLLIYGGTLEHLTSSFSDNNLRWFEITSDTDKNMAVIADVHTVPNNYLEEGVGSASQIFVAVPIGGKLYLTRGAVFSYYEFISGSRLTDEEWQKMIKDKKQPKLPDWTETFTAGSKDAETIPVPAEPYDSGC